MTRDAAPARPGRLDGLRVIDADSHLTEPHDLWTSRAPAAFRDRVPRVEAVDGRPAWVVDGVAVGLAMPASVIARDGTKARGAEFLGWSIEDTHPGAYSVPDRLHTMDEQGIWAQIVYPNTFGFGGQGFMKVHDEEVRLLTARLFNDAMAEIQEASGGRLLPMAVIPWWDIDAAVIEVRRAAGLGLRGINTTTGPHNHGLPDLGTAHWDPLWETCVDLALPVNFHIGAADSDMAWFGSVSWPSLGMDQKLGLGSAMLYLNNAGVLANMIYSGVLERHPALQIVSVESGVGWVPFFMQALDYQLAEMTQAVADSLSIAPSEYFRRQIHACFWFERAGIANVVEVLGHERLLFETDFPHPTCTYPDGVALALDSLAGLDEHVVAALMGGNAARLYNVAG
jgi:predicted TIM-barrel fold metal-dependent hydrolase